MIRTVIIAVGALLIGLAFGRTCSPVRTVEVPRIVERPTAGTLTPTRPPPPPEVRVVYRTRTVRDTVVIEVPREIIREVQTAPVLARTDAVEVARPLFRDPRVTFTYYDLTEQRVVQDTWRLRPRPVVAGLEASVEVAPTTVEPEARVGLYAGHRRLHVTAGVAITPDGTQPRVGLRARWP